MGGETAEMPDFYHPGEYDLSGFGVGAVKKDKLIHGEKNVRKGDVVLGLPSSGVHSNGFSLVRKIMERSNTSYHAETPWGAGKFGHVLLAPTIIYVKDLLKLHGEVGVLAAAHITGEGHPGNIPRVLPKGLTARIRKDSWKRPEIFNWLQKAGGVSEDEMFLTFNMGIGVWPAVHAAPCRTPTCLPRRHGGGRPAGEQGQGAQGPATSGPHRWVLAPLRMTCPWRLTNCIPQATLSRARRCSSSDRSPFGRPRVAMLHTVQQSEPNKQH